MSGLVFLAKKRSLSILRGRLLVVSATVRVLWWGRRQRVEDFQSVFQDPIRHHDRIRAKWQCRCLLEGSFGARLGGVDLPSFWFFKSVLWCFSKTLVLKITLIPLLSRALLASNFLCYESISLSFNGLWQFCGKCLAPMKKKIIDVDNTQPPPPPRGQLYKYFHKVDLSTGAVTVFHRKNINKSKYRLDEYYY